MSRRAPPADAPAEGTPARPRGRPRSFDVDAVVDAAMRVLWERGYERTSIEELVEATGVHASSLYAAFGSKRGILDAALDRYEAGMVATIATVRDGAAGLDDVVAFLGRLRRHVASPNSALGCLMVNTMTERSPHDPKLRPRTSRYRALLLDGLEAGLVRAAAQGEIASGTVGDRARLLQSGVFGALVLARAGARDEAVAAIDALTEQVDRWRWARPG